LMFGGVTATAILVAFVAELLLSRRLCVRPHAGECTICATTSSSSGWTRSASASSVI
jgi:hypothetical protein